MVLRAGLDIVKATLKPVLADYDVKTSAGPR
jgi:hypothetical protein